jgi:hypothetical protein
MPLNSRVAVTASYLAVVIAVAVGAAGYVRSSAIILSLATIVITTSRSARGRIERYLPILLAIALFALAIALPHGR